MTDDTQPKWATLTRHSTREEVLAAVEEHEAATAAVRDDIDRYDDPAMFPGMPADPAARQGCYWTADGKVRVHYGGPTHLDEELAKNAAVDPRVRAIQLERQQLSGEEDQSAPDWPYPG